MGVANSKTLSQSFLSHFFEYLCCTIRVKKNDFILKIYYTIKNCAFNLLILQFEKNLKIDIMASVQAHYGNLWFQSTNRHFYYICYCGWMSTIHAYFIVCCGYNLTREKRGGMMSEEELFLQQIGQRIMERRKNLGLTQELWQRKAMWQRSLFPMQRLGSGLCGLKTCWKSLQPWC